MTDDSGKLALRARMIALRATIPAAVRSTASRDLADLHLSGIGFFPGCTVSGFLSIGDEIDPQPLMQRLQSRGLHLCLPVMLGKDQPLQFRTYRSGDDLATVQWGIRQPREDQPIVEPDVLLVPLLAVDPKGQRLGYGGGYYDRTIKHLRAKKRIVAIGLGYDLQMIDAVPHLDYDETLDWVLTPSGPVRCRR
jgi:5-formyltetrahydrofolate cyclo-ligase